MPHHYAAPVAGHGARVGPVAYVMSRFPKISETFILYEMEAVVARGVSVELFPLIRERPAIQHPEAAAWVARAHHAPVLSPAVVASNLALLVGRPWAYLGALAAVVRGTWGSANFLLGGLAAFPKVAHAARRMEGLGVAHVHCHFANHPALAGFVVHRLTGIPYSFTAHGSDLHKDRHMLPQKVREAAFVATVSEDNRRLIVEECGAWAADKVHVIHCGVDVERFGGARREPGGEDALSIVCVGTLHEVKGQVHLVDACARLARGGVPFTCTFVGDGPDQRGLERRASESGLGDRVRFLGRVAQPEIVAQLRRADVLVAPSVPTASGKREGIPVVLMEAMASGLPVVASRLSGIPELVEDGVSGLLVEPGDVDGLAAALRELRDPRRRAALGAAGVRAVREGFDLHANAGRLLAEIAKVQTA